MGFVAAIGFPFTQTNDHYANLGVNILIFGTVALGLNIVVGLAGLLDLGYVAFLGVGAYTAALVSGSEFSKFSGVQFPFWAAALTGAAASLVFGVLIGAPTLRLRGDYLAIVTLGFGEIFRIAVNNMDGVSGPDITNGPNGIPSIPDLSFFGFNFGDSHDIGGFTIGRFANYYLLMVLIMALVVTIYRRASDSRIGRSWIAIREDETAATAMGINGFRVKLIAFALGATLAAGLAGRSAPTSPTAWCRTRTSSPERPRPTPRSSWPPSSSAAWAPSPDPSSAPPCSTSSRRSSSPSRTSRSSPSASRSSS